MTLPATAPSRASRPAGFNHAWALESSAGLQNFDAEHSDSDIMI